MHTDAGKYDRWPRLKNLAFRYKLYRHFKTVRGILRTYLPKPRYREHIGHGWWDSYYSTQTIDDAHTLEPGKDLFPTLVHYKSVESLLLGQFYNLGLLVEGAAVLDIGSGAGHWIKFYRGLGASEAHGVEISKVAADRLAHRYEGESSVTIHNTSVGQLQIDRQFDIVNAIGVMFHIVEDSEFEQSVRRLCELLRPGGTLIVGGHFGWLDGLNVQFDAEGRVNKRLRSRAHWKRLLADFAEVEVHINRGYQLINATLPENNLLIARKRP